MPTAPNASTNKDLSDQLAKEIGAKLIAGAEKIAPGDHLLQYAICCKILSRVCTGLVSIFAQSANGCATLGLQLIADLVSGINLAWAGHAAKEGNTRRTSEN
jgi:hypothetical protein